jgi:hypothetical protein
MFGLNIYVGASRLYSQWLMKADATSIICREKSIANIRELRRRGFQISERPVEGSGVFCAADLEWNPYVRIPAR